MLLDRHTVRDSEGRVLWEMTVPAGTMVALPAMMTGENVISSIYRFETKPDREKEGVSIVGEGPEYVDLLDAARALVPEWCPGGYRGNHWGALGGGVMPTDDGRHELVLTDDETFRPARTKLDLNILRAGAISLLIYCEAVGQGD